MKKDIIKRIAIVAVLLALVIIWLRGRNVKVLEEVKTSDIDTIVLEISGYITVTEQEDMRKIVDILQSMELDRTYDKEKDGCGIIVNIYFKDGSENVFVFYEDDVAVDGDFYNCDSKYCDELRELYDEFAEKYPSEG